MLVDDVLSRRSSSLPSLPIAQRHQKRDVVTEVMSSAPRAIKMQDSQKASLQTINSARQSVSRPNVKGDAATGTGYTTRHFEAGISLQPQ
jgi:hypothetical protein